MSGSVRVWKEFRLYCAHSIRSFGENHKCAALHGHTYKIRVEVHCDIDPTTNISMPFDDIEAAWQECGGIYDHTNLNDSLCPNPTTEALAMQLQGQLTVAIGKPVTITVQETESSGVTIVGGAIE